MRKPFEFIKLFFIAFFFVYPFSALPSQNIPFRVDIDFAQFRYQRDSTYLEIYYAYNEAQLTFTKKDETFEGAILMYVTVEPLFTDSLIVNTVWRIPHIVTDINNLDQGKSFVGVMGFVIPRGSHILTVKSFDGNNTLRSDSISYQLLDKSFRTANIALSDIQLCSSIKKIPKDPNNIFYKNTLEVIPNPTGVFGLGKPILFYYLEVYNIPTMLQDKTYRIKVTVYDSNKQEVITHTRTKSRINESSVEIGTVNVGSLSGGSYKLVFSLIDSASDQIVSSGKRFYIYNPQKTLDRIPATAFDIMMASEYGTMSEEELDKEFAIAQYIASSSEKSQYDQLSSVDAKREFLFKFWKSRDRRPKTPINEFKQEYMSRVEYTNTHFRSGSREGWKSDRGRVFIIYGPPDEYEYHTYEANIKPYEIWYYHNIQGGVIFVFADLFGFKDYVLLHSTHRDEIRDENWKSQILER